MDARQLKTLQQQIRTLESGTARRYSPELREHVVDAVHALRREGASYKSISTKLGVSLETVRRMHQSEARTPVQAVAVEIEEDAPAVGVRVVHPSGVRVEGLDVEQVATLLRALS